MRKQFELVSCWIAALMLILFLSCNPIGKNSSDSSMKAIVTDLNEINKLIGNAYLFHSDESYVYRFRCEVPEDSFVLYDQSNCTIPEGQVPAETFKAALHDYHELQLSKEGKYPTSSLEDGISRLLMQITLNKNEISKLLSEVGQDLSGSTSIDKEILRELEETQEDFANVGLVLIELNSQIANIAQINLDSELKQHLKALEKERQVLLDQIAVLRQTMEQLKKKYVDSKSALFSELHFSVLTNQWAFYIEKLAQARESYRESLDMEASFQLTLQWMSSQAGVVMNFSSDMVASDQYISVGPERFVRYLNVVFEFMIGPGAWTNSLPSAWPGQMQVVAGTGSTCILSPQGVDCWGRDNYNLDQVPVLNEPHFLGEFDNTACVIDKIGVKCWGANLHHELDIPLLKNPVSVAANSGIACAIDDEGLKCWGEHYYYPSTLKIPKLTKPAQVSIAGGYVCALDLDGVKCWGDIKEGRSKMPKLVNPRQITSGFSNTCALDDEGVKCWGQVRNSQPKLKNPRQISGGAWFMCALDDEGVKCWGDNDRGQTNVPRLYNPVSISAGAFHACALDDEGIKCWGENRDGESTVPNRLRLNTK